MKITHVSDADAAQTIANSARKVINEHPKMKSYSSWIDDAALLDAGKRAVKDLQELERQRVTEERVDER